MRRELVHDPLPDRQRVAKDRFHVEAHPADAVAAQAVDRHPGAGERRAVRTLAVPAPFGPCRVAGGGAPEQLGLEVALVAQDLLPVPPQLVSSPKAAIGPCWLLASHVLVEAVHER